MEGPIDAKDLEADLPLAEWLPIQLGRFTELSELQQIVRCVDQWFRCSFHLSFKYATYGPEQAPADAQQLYTTCHRQIRSKTIADHLLRPEGDKHCALKEIYIPALERVAQCTLLHVDMGKAQQFARWAIDVVHGCGLGWYKRLGWVLIPGGKQADRIFPSDAEQAWQLRNATEAEATDPEHCQLVRDRKQARNVLRQDALCAPFVVEVTTCPCVHSTLH